MNEKDNEAGKGNGTFKPGNETTITPLEQLREFNREKDSEEVRGTVLGNVEYNGNSYGIGITHLGERCIILEENVPLFLWIYNSLRNFNLRLINSITSHRTDFNLEEELEKYNSIIGQIKSTDILDKAEGYFDSDERSFNTSFINNLEETISEFYKLRNKYLERREIKEKITSSPGVRLNSEVEI